MADIIRKTISFGDNEQDLYDFCIENSEAKGKKFATFVKEILRQKMNQNESIETIIDKRIEEYLKNKNVVVNTESEKAISKYGEDEKSYLNNFLKKNV